MRSWEEWQFGALLQIQLIDEYWSILFASYPSPNSKCLSYCQQGLRSKTQPPPNKGVKTPRKPAGAGFVLLMVEALRQYCLLCVIMKFCCGLVWFNLFPMVWYVDCHWLTECTRESVYWRSFHQEVCAVTSTSPGPSAQVSYESYLEF